MNVPKEDFFSFQTLLRAGWSRPPALRGRDCSSRCGLAPTARQSSFPVPPIVCTARPSSPFARKLAGTTRRGPAVRATSRTRGGAIVTSRHVGPSLGVAHGRFDHCFWPPPVFATGRAIVSACTQHVYVSRVGPHMMSQSRKPLPSTPFPLPPTGHMDASRSHACLLLRVHASVPSFRAGPKRRTALEQCIPPTWTQEEQRHAFRTNAAPCPPPSSYPAFRASAVMCTPSRHPISLLWQDTWQPRLHLSLRFYYWTLSRGIAQQAYLPYSVRAVLCTI